MNISGIFKLFAHWSDCVDRNDKVFTLLYKIVMHKKVSHPDEIQNTIEVILIYNKIILQDRTRDGGSLHVGRHSLSGMVNCRMQNNNN